MLLLSRNFCELLQAYLQKCQAQKLVLRVVRMAEPIGRCRNHNPEWILVLSSIQTVDARLRKRDGHVPHRCRRTGLKPRHPNCHGDTLLASGRQSMDHVSPNPSTPYLYPPASPVSTYLLSKRRAAIVSHFAIRRIVSSRLLDESKISLGKASVCETKMYIDRPAGSR